MSRNQPEIDRFSERKEAQFGAAQFRRSVPVREAEEIQQERATVYQK
jgi:hypothetical protein